jgi:hypothetical protein
MTTRGTGGTTSPTTPSISWSWPSSPVRASASAPGRSSERSRTAWAIGHRRCSPAMSMRPTRRPSPRPSANPSRSRRAGRPRVAPRRRPAAGLAYVTVRKQRKTGRVVSIRRTVVLGDESAVEDILRESACSRTINTSFVERRHATDRGQNARKSRRTYRFSKDWQVHEAMTCFTAYCYNFCWTV